MPIASGGGLGLRFGFELGPDPGEGAEVLVVEPVEEEAAEVAVVLPPCFAQERASFAGEDRFEAAAVLGRAAALDESAVFEPVGEAGGAAAAHEAAFGEFGHPHAGRSEEGRGG